MTTQVTSTTAADTKRRKALLEAKLKELLRVSREGIQIDYLPDPTDQVRSNIDREITIQRLNQQARLIHDVQSALDTIEQGAYGHCERCESPISRKRLDAVPWASLCVDCQSESEAGVRNRRSPFAHAA